LLTLRTRHYRSGVRLLIFHMGTWGFPLGEAKQRELYISQETTDTLGTPLPISLKWLECSHKEMWDLK